MTTMHIKWTSNNFLKLWRKLWQLLRCSTEMPRLGWISLKPKTLYLPSFKPVIAMTTLCVVIAWNYDNTKDTHCTRTDYDFWITFSLKALVINTRSGEFLGNPETLLDNKRQVHIIHFCHSLLQFIICHRNAVRYPTATLQHYPILKL